MTTTPTRRPVSTPDRLTAIWNQLPSADRLVLRGEVPGAPAALGLPGSDLTLALRDADGTPVLVMDLATAELVKVSANAFLATKISFINAVAQVCERVGADVDKVADGMGFDAYGLEVQRIVAMFIDGHARVGGFGYPGGGVMPAPRKKPGCGG